MFDEIYLNDTNFPHVLSTVFPHYYHDTSLRYILSTYLSTSYPLFHNIFRVYPQPGYNFPKFIRFCVYITVGLLYIHNLSTANVENLSTFLDMCIVLIYLIHISDPQVFHISLVSIDMIYLIHIFVHKFSTYSKYTHLFEVCPLLVWRTYPLIHIITVQLLHSYCLRIANVDKFSTISGVYIAAIYLIHNQSGQVFHIF